MLALLPPNAKEFDIAYLMSFSSGLLAMKLMSPDFSARTFKSSSLYPVVGGSFPSVRALTVRTASIAPAAPRQ